MRRRDTYALALGVALVVAACGSDSASSNSDQLDGGAGGASGAGGAGGTATADSGAQRDAAGGSGGSGGNGGKDAASDANQAGTGGTSDAGEAGTTPGSALPEGNTGIASQHPGDVGIKNDSAVIFADDFESYAMSADLNGPWDAVYQNQDVRIATETANVHAGKQALEFTLPQETTELSDATDKVLTNEEDVLFLRYYSKFQPPYDVVGSSHNGSSISAHYFINGQATPGVPADGMNKFLVNLEDWRGEAATPSPGPLNVYVYHPEQRSQYGDHFFASGMVLPNSSLPFDFGPDFVSRPDITPELDRWYCYEYMVRANTPGKRDGRIAFWLDGKLAADFGNLRFRDIGTLKINRFGLSFHIGSNPNGEAKKWYDDVVAARSYIGPIAP